MKFRKRAFFPETLSHLDGIQVFLNLVTQAVTTFQAALFLCRHEQFCIAFDFTYKNNAC